MREEGGGREEGTRKREGWEGGEVEYKGEGEKEVVGGGDGWSI